MWYKDKVSEAGSTARNHQPQGNHTQTQPAHVAHTHATVHGRTRPGCSHTHTQAPIPRGPHPQPPPHAHTNSPPVPQPGSRALKGHAAQAAKPHPETPTAIPGASQPPPAKSAPPITRTPPCSAVYLDPQPPNRARPAEIPSVAIPRQATRNRTPSATPFGANGKPVPPPQ